MDSEASEEGSEADRHPHGPTGLQIKIGLDYSAASGGLHSAAAIGSAFFAWDRAAQFCPPLIVRTPKRFILNNQKH